MLGSRRTRSRAPSFCGKSGRIARADLGPFAQHGFELMRRRALVSLLGSVTATWPLAARAQQPGKLATIGFLGAGTPSAWSQWTAAFVQRMRELGWIEGHTILIEYRWAEGRTARYAEIVAELVQLKVDVIITGGAEAVIAA